MIPAVLELLQRHGAQWLDAKKHSTGTGLEKPVIRHAYTLGRYEPPYATSHLLAFEHDLEDFARRNGIQIASRGNKKTYSGSGFQIVFDPLTTEGGADSPRQVKLFLERALAATHLPDQSSSVLKSIALAEKKAAAKKQSAKRATDAGLKGYYGGLQNRRHR